MEQNKKSLILFTDIGDTIIDEGTEVRDDRGVVIHADCIPTARETYLRLHEAGYTIVMVADGLTASFRNLMAQHGLPLRAGRPIPASCWRRPGKSCW